MNAHHFPILLLAEDDDDISDVATEWLESAGFRVRLARHGGEVLQQLDAHDPPAAILLDLNMPVMNGWDVWAWLQSSPFKDVPVVIWTATGLRQGAIGDARIVQKGSDPRDLLKALHEAVARPSLEAAAP